MRRPIELQGERHRANSLKIRKIQPRQHLRNVGWKDLAVGREHVQEKFIRTLEVDNSSAGVQGGLKRANIQSLDLKISEFPLCIALDNGGTVDKVDLRNKFLKLTEVESVRSEM